MRIAVVGAGAAGLVAAIVAARKGARVDLYEKESEAGRKILASGNGRCNISNTALNITDYTGEDPTFAAYAIRRFDYGALRRFFEGIGLLLTEQEDGKVYPLSREARAVREALVREVRRLGVALYCESPVTGLEKKKEGFVLTAPLGARRYDRVLIAAGSPAAPQLGGSTDGIVLADSFGHAVQPCYPALVGLHLPGSLHERLAGLKVYAGVTLYIDGRKRQRIEGDLLFTRYGISGFAVLDISTEASRALADGRDVTVGIDLMPDMQRQAVAAKLQKMAAQTPWLKTVELLQGAIPAKLALALLRSLTLPTDTACGEMGAKTWRKVAARLCDWRFSVIGTHGYRHAEVAGGGVKTDGIDEKSMQSRLIGGLYFAGEVIDIVGRRGGFNLHFAFATGFLAGESMVK